MQNEKSSDTTAFSPGFDVDYNDCGDDPIVSDGGVSFGFKRKCSLRKSVL